MDQHSGPSRVGLATVLKAKVRNLHKQVISRDLEIVALLACYENDFC